MRLELEAAGHKVQFMVINKDNAAAHQEKLTKLCAFPLFQDTEDGYAWEVHNGGKDDILIYDTDGRVEHFLPHGGSLSTNLATMEGYENVKSAILDTLGP